MRLKVSTARNKIPKSLTNEEVEVGTGRRGTICGFIIVAGVRAVGR